MNEQLSFNHSKKFDFPSPILIVLQILIFQIHSPLLVNRYQLFLFPFLHLYFTLCSASTIYTDFDWTRSDEIFFGCFQFFFGNLRAYFNQKIQFFLSTIFHFSRLLLIIYFLLLSYYIIVDVNFCWDFHFFAFLTFLRCYIHYFYYILVRNRIKFLNLSSTFWKAILFVSIFHSSSTYYTIQEFFKIQSLFRISLLF